MLHQLLQINVAQQRQQRLQKSLHSRMELSSAFSHHWRCENCSWGMAWNSTPPFTRIYTIHLYTHLWHIYLSTRYDRRKFMSQTSDNMDRWKSRDGKSQRTDWQKRRSQIRERVSRKKIEVCEKVGKSTNTVFFQCFVTPKGRKIAR